MSMIVLADRTGSVIADENSSPSETFVLQPDAGSDTSETFRLERLHRLIRQRELDLLSSSVLDILSSDDDEEVGAGSSVLVEATTTRDGEVHSQYLFEDLKVFTNYLQSQGFVRRRPHPTDRRAKLVETTPKGDALAAQADAILATPPPALSALSPDELETLRTILGRVKA